MPAHLQLRAQLVLKSGFHHLRRAGLGARRPRSARKILNLLEEMKARYGLTLLFNRA